MKYKTGFVLSGGGARGFAHLGIIDALQAKGITPDIISGVSAGAIIGAFISSGKTPHEIHQILKTGNLFRYTNLTIPGSGLLKLVGLQKLLDKEIPFRHIEDLPIPLIVGVTNVTDGRTEYLSEGPLSRAILASSSIPVLFAPVEIGGKQYCDGGLLENIPVNPLVGLCRKIVVSNISPLQKHAEVKNLIQMAIRTFHISIHSRIREAQNHADIYIEPEKLTQLDLLSVSQADEAYEIGYNAVASLDGKQLEDFYLTESRSRLA